jgi:hypothetical protein
MLPVLGFHQFLRNDSQLGPEDEGAVDEGSSTVKDTVRERSGGGISDFYKSLPQGMVFRITSRGANATLVLEGGGVVVKKGSRVANPVSERFDLETPGYAAKRRELTESKVISMTDEGLVFTQDQFFTTGSAASSVLRGTLSTSDWCIGDEGKSLGDYIRKAKNRA